MTARIGSPKTGGRVKGSLDKNARQLLSNEMANDLMTVYKRLGGVKWLLKFAEDNPTEFLRQGLSRLFPAPQKADDEPGGGTYNQFNFNGQSDFEHARNIAFALSLGLQAQQELAPVAERVPGTPEPVAEVPRWRPPTDAPDMVEAYDDQPAPYSDQSNTAFVYDAKDARPYDVQHAAWMLTKDTIEKDISSYAGASAEQGGGGRHRPMVQTKRSAAELCRSLSRRGRDLI